jgi:hypothetical protein
VDAPGFGIDQAHLRTCGDVFLIERSRIVKTLDLARSFMVAPHGLLFTPKNAP